MAPERCDVLVIGAGPAGAVAAALLVRRGLAVTVLERQHFPRFSIGESLLAHCLDILEEAGMLGAVHRAGFQYKNGALFVCGGQSAEFNFGDKFGAGYHYTFQVPRADFDKLLADEAARRGADIRYGEEIVAADFATDTPVLRARNAAGAEREFRARFVLDASGFGRVLPRLLELGTPSNLPPRRAFFTHIEDHLAPGEFDRQKIRVTVLAEHPQVWFWLIPFSNGRASLGVVVDEAWLADRGADNEAVLRGAVAQDPGLTALLRNARFDTPVNTLGGYSANVRAMHGPGFALLGNAAEFLDPVFSSGVTIALHSASLAAPLVERVLAGGAVDWEGEFERPLRGGVDAFRSYVTGWYDGRFQRVVFSGFRDAAGGTRVKQMICAVLAGYAWDRSNPFVAESERRLATLAGYCEMMEGGLQ
jgi:flavin-dependent dehydrogenase